MAVVAKRSISPKATSKASVSPQNSIDRSFGSSDAPNVGSDKHRRANDGVETQIVASDDARRRHSLSGPARWSRVMLKTELPDARATQVSMQDRSNEYGATFRKTSSGCVDCSA